MTTAIKPDSIWMGSGALTEARSFYIGLTYDYWFFTRLRLIHPPVAAGLRLDIFGWADQSSIKIQTVALITVVQIGE